MRTSKAILRAVVFNTLKPFVKYRAYDGGVAGWDGWHELAGIVLAFRASDGSLSFRW